MLLYHFPLNTQENIDGFVNNGMKNDATIVNNSGYSVASDGKVSAKSLLCNGRSLKLPFDNKDKTIAMRLKFPSTLVDSKYLFKIYNSSNTNIKSGPYTWNALGLQLGTTTIVPKSNTNWFDFVMVFTSSGQNAYIDGVLKLTQTTDVSTASYIRILTGTQGSQDYNGYVQDIRIYDYALSQAEINEYSRAMVVHYPLQGNELNPSVLKDVSGFVNDYTLQGTNSYQLDSARGVKSLHTTDTAIYTQTPISSGYTTSFWCKYNGEWKHLCNNGSKYMNGVVNSSLYDTIYATLTASGYDIADYRVYATALSAEDIKNLYNSPIAVSKQHQSMAFEFVEGNDGFSAKKSGIVQHNELRENDSDVNGCYNNKLITNELIEQ